LTKCHFCNAETAFAQSMKLLPVPLLEVIWQQIEHLFYWRYNIMFCISYFICYRV